MFQKVISDIEQKLKLNRLRSAEAPESDLNQSGESDKVIIRTYTL